MRPYEVIDFLTREDAIKVISRYVPCEHMTIDYSLGDGRTWVKCEDCGVTFSREKWGVARIGSILFQKAIDILSKESKEKPIKLFLPDGDNRTARIAFRSEKEDCLELCIIIDEPKPKQEWKD